MKRHTVPLFRKKEIKKYIDKLTQYIESEFSEKEAILLKIKFQMLIWLHFEIGVYEKGGVYM